MGDTTSVTEYLSAWLQHELEQQVLAGLSSAVLDGQQVTWSAGFGLANKADKTPATARTRYRAGSIAKLFTSAAAQRLAERGLLDIDAPLEQSLPGFAIRRRAGQTGAVTPRTIMTHHSGLPSDWIEGMWTDTPVAYTELVEALLRAETLAFPPGQVYAYSNLAFSLLGAAIEQASGQTLPAVRHSQICTPWA